MVAYLVVNFGGPRNLEEIEPFLKELFADRDVIERTLPEWIHDRFFAWVAKKRAKKIAKDYESIGGGSPIYQDTENLASALQKELGAKVFTFHRYLPQTHVKRALHLENAQEKEIRVIPLFPQFSFATTGSIAGILQKLLSKSTLQKLAWAPTYARHSAFISHWQKHIQKFLSEKNLNLRETLLLFSAHGLPKKFVEEGDPYEKECIDSFLAISKPFPHAKLSYQSKFGRGVWLTPSTEEVCKQEKSKKNIVIIPFTFTSDHIETLFEIEKQYLPLIQERGLKAYRCPVVSDLAPVLSKIAQDSTFLPTHFLIKNLQK